MNTMLAELVKADPSLVSLAVKHQLRAGECLAEPNKALTEAWFPLDCVLSVSALLRDGAAVDVLSIGRHGMAGTSDLLSGISSGGRFSCRVSGLAVALPLAALDWSADHRPDVRYLIRQHTARVLRDLVRSTACHRFHSINGRFATWLLTIADLTGDRTIEVTHEVIATVLGVQRQTVTVAAESLRGKGLIDYRRGQLILSDLAGLEAIACDCRETLELLVPWPADAPAVSGTRQTGIVASGSFAACRSQ